MLRDVLEGTRTSLGSLDDEFQNSGVDPYEWINLPPEERQKRIRSSAAKLKSPLGRIGKTERSHPWEGKRLSDLEAGNPSAVPTRTARASQINCIWYGSDAEPVAAYEVENTTTITDGIVRMANLVGVKHRAIVLPQARKPLLVQKLREPMLNPSEGRTWTFMFYEVVDDLLRRARQGELNVEDVWGSFEVEALMTEAGQGLLFPRG